MTRTVSDFNATRVQRIRKHGDFKGSHCDNAMLHNGVECHLIFQSFKRGILLVFFREETVSASRVTFVKG